MSTTCMSATVQTPIGTTCSVITKNIHMVSVFHPAYGAPHLSKFVCGFLSSFVRFDNEFSQNTKNYVRAFRTIQLYHICVCIFVGTFEGNGQQPQQLRKSYYTMVQGKFCFCLLYFENNFVKPTIPSLECSLQ